ncbi:MAG: hypothetical protein IEMM0008_1295 [bacterium]|nr:MAG: hypothetical protein IEMM0008_1295 [bacterium]
MRYLVPVLLILFVYHCSGSAGGLARSERYQKRKILSTSLFGDGDILTEKAIARILRSRIVLPRKMKLAVIAFQHESPKTIKYYGYNYLTSQSFINMNAEYFKAIERPLFRTKRFIEITIVPKLLLPKKISIKRLRVLAVRMQADFLLVYKTYSNIFSEYHVFIKNEATAYSTVELALFHVRTGLIPYAQVHTAVHKEYEKDEIDILELERRSEKLATLKALKKATLGLMRFLKVHKKRKRRSNKS